MKADRENIIEVPSECFIEPECSLEDLEKLEKGLLNQFGVGLKNIE